MIESGDGITASNRLADRGGKMTQDETFSQRISLINMYRRPALRREIHIVCTYQNIIVRIYYSVVIVTITHICRLCSIPEYMI